VLSIVRRKAPGTAELDTFLMSCRVLGRFIEDQILEHIVKELRSEGISRLLVRFVPTKKNVPARTFVERLRGGCLVSSAAESRAQTWEFDISNTSPVTKAVYAEL